MDEFDIKEGLSMKLTKFIPVAAGMAGGSSDAAAAFVGVNRLFRLGLSEAGTDEDGQYRLVRMCRTVLCVELHWQRESERS